MDFYRIKSREVPYIFEEDTPITRARPIATTGDHTIPLEEDDY